MASIKPTYWVPWACEKVDRESLLTTHHFVALALIQMG